MPFIKGQVANKAGRPKGSLSGRVALKNMLDEAFIENGDKAKKLIKNMFDDEKNFKWLCELKASLEPKELEHSGEANRTVVIVNYGTSKSTSSFTRV